MSDGFGDRKRSSSVDLRQAQRVGVKEQCAAVTKAPAPANSDESHGYVGRRSKCTRIKRARRSRERDHPLGVLAIVGARALLHEHDHAFAIRSAFKLEGAADGKGVIVLMEKGASADDRKHAEGMIAFAAAARAFYASAFGPAPDVPVRLVAVRRGGGFSDGGTLLFDADALRLPKIDAATALSIAEAVGHLWIGGQAPVRGEGNGVLRDALVRFLATEFLQKQFGADAVDSELYRQRIAYASVAQRDGPLARGSQLDSTYFNSVPNRGAMFWRLDSAPS